MAAKTSLQKPKIWGVNLERKRGVNLLRKQGGQIGAEKGGQFQRIFHKLLKTLPIAFKSVKPQNEGELNDKINAILEGEREEYKREFPSVSFALAKAIPDHSLNGAYLFVEAKFIRTNTTPSVASEGISADLIKYPADTHKLFIVYDPGGKISDKGAFKKDFESKGVCTVTIVS